MPVSETPVRLPGTRQRGPGRGSWNQAASELRSRQLRISQSQFPEDTARGEKPDSVVRNDVVRLERQRHCLACFFLSHCTPFRETLHLPAAGRVGRNLTLASCWLPWTVAWRQDCTTTTTTAVAPGDPAVLLLLLRNLLRLRLLGGVG